VVTASHWRPLSSGGPYWVMANAHGDVGQMPAESLA